MCNATSEIARLFLEIPSGDSCGPVIVFGWLVVVFGLLDVSDVSIEELIIVVKRAWILLSQFNNNAVAIWLVRPFLSLLQWWRVVPALRLGVVVQCLVGLSLGLWLSLVNLIVQVFVWIDFALVELGLERVLLCSFFQQLVFDLLFTLVVDLLGVVENVVSGETLVSVPL